MSSEYKQEPELFLLTGEFGCGKTIWCLELVQRARIAGIEPVGLVSPAVLEKESKIGIDLLNIVTGECQRLAVKRDRSPFAPPQPGLPTQNWLINPAVLAWGNQILEGLPRTGELLVLDELGPLEFMTNTGLTEGLRRIESRKYRLVCVVIRPELLDAALARWPWGQVVWASSQSGKVERE